MECPKRKGEGYSIELALLPLGRQIHSKVHEIGLTGDRIKFMIRALTYLETVIYNLTIYQCRVVLILDIQQRILFNLQPMGSLE